jgi:hypothetical protein
VIVLCCSFYFQEESLAVLALSFQSVIRLTCETSVFFSLYMCRVDFLFQLYFYFTSLCLGHAVAYWLRNCATNQKVMSSIPDEVNF